MNITTCGNVCAAGGKSGLELGGGVPIVAPKGDIDAGLRGTFPSGVATLGAWAMVAAANSWSRCDSLFCIFRGGSCGVDASDGEEWRGVKLPFGPAAPGRTAGDV